VQIYLAGAVRTPIGRFGGGLAGLTAVELGTRACVAALERAGVEREHVDQAIFGHARQAGCGPNPARQVAVAAGVPVERPSFTINQACLSGMQAILDAARVIRLGEAEVVLAGGMESMSQVPHLVEARWGFRMGDRPVVDAMYRDGFLDPLSGKIMGETAETLARQYEISRDEQDAWAALSQQRCQQARGAGRFKDEIVAVEAPDRKGSRIVDNDEHPRDDVRAESLAKLRPVFDKEGTVTAGNSSGITDGAAAMVVLSGDAARKLGVEPMARVVGHRVEGVDPAIMGIGPVPAVRNLAKDTGVSPDEIDLVELKNVNGGAIALGHPIGCSGARIVVTLLHEMARRACRRGLATLCVSGGMGGALLLERTED
jgi:acetyl-CoA C-acetyltransferase